MRYYYNILSDMCMESLKADGTMAEREINDTAIRVKYAGGFDYAVQLQQQDGEVERFSGMEAREEAAKRLTQLA